MRFRSQYCLVCEDRTMFLEKLKSATDPNCIEMEDICQVCNNKFYVKEDKRIKIKL